MALHQVREEVDVDSEDYCEEDIEYLMGETCCVAWSLDAEDGAG